jgi:toxin secretion/phage lysis holin
LKENGATVNTTMTTKTAYIILFGCSLSWVPHIVDKYVFSDWGFLRFFVIIVALDTFTGIVKHWKAKTISSRGFGGIFIKMLVYVPLLVMTHILGHFPIDGMPNGFFDWFDDVAYSSLVVKESISIVENLGSIEPKLIPTWILKRLKEFDETGQKHDVKKEISEA